MRIEKINDRKLKILLTNDDLKKRDIKMTELAFGTDKTRELFKEMMNIATDEYDFDAEDSQLMIEAIPISLEAIMILVTKMDDDQKDSFSKKIKSKNLKKDDSHLSIFEFNTLEDVVLVAKTLFGRFTDENYLMKMKGKYYLLLQNDNELDEISDNDLEIIIGEYGKKCTVNSLSRAYFFEHGEMIANNPAIDILSEYL